MKNIKLLLLFVFVYACSTDVPISKKYVSERVIIIVVDGPRYQETWDKANQVLIPYRKNMAKDGVLFSNFSNSGITYTNCGHTSITTGVNQNIDNAGNQLPNQPSIFQYYQKEKKVPASKCQIITSKDKLSVLSNCVNIAWRNTYMPEYDCGVSGPHSGYRSDEETFQVALRVLSQKKPNLALIQFKEPDNSGHSGDWDAYIRGIHPEDGGSVYLLNQKKRFYF
ncbi:MAG: hypothetical protein HYZ42_13585 [Bacteroidetes bacterium]|nr:hypothetical protein [Bacteroidota bacterium]